MEVTTNRCIRQIITWPTRNKLSIAPHEIEFVRLIAERKVKTIIAEVVETRITSQKNIKYLGVRFNINMTMRHHVWQAAKKSTRAQATITRLMLNVSDLYVKNGKILSSVVQSINLYGASI